MQEVLAYFTKFLYEKKKINIKKRERKYIVRMLKINYINYPKLFGTMVIIMNKWSNYNLSSSCCHDWSSRSICSSRLGRAGGDDDGLFSWYGAFDATLSFLFSKNRWSDTLVTICKPATTQNPTKKNVRKKNI